MTVNHSVKQYIDESLPALLEKLGNFINLVWKLVAMCKLNVHFWCIAGFGYFYATFRAPADGAAGNWPMYSNCSELHELPLSE